MLIVLSRISNFVYKLVNYLVAILMSFLAITVMLTVIFRFVIHLPLAWTEELSRLLLVWIAFLAASSAFKKGLHISMNVVQEKLSGKIKLVITIISLFLVLFFLIFVFFIGLRTSLRQWIQNTPIFEIPYTFVYGAVPVGMLLMALHTIVDILNNFYNLFLSKNKF